MRHEEAAARSLPRVPALASRAVRVSLSVAAAVLGLGAAVAWLGPILVGQIVRLLNFSVQGFVWIVGGSSRASTPGASPPRSRGRSAPA